MKQYRVVVENNDEDKPTQCDLDAVSIEAAAVHAANRLRLDPGEWEVVVQEITKPVNVTLTVQRTAVARIQLPASDEQD